MRGESIMCFKGGRYENGSPPDQGDASEIRSLLIPSWDK